MTIHLLATATITVGALWCGCDAEQGSMSVDATADALDFGLCEVSEDNFENNAIGAYPWEGYTHWNEAATEFVCNRCPNGDRYWQGTWVRMNAEAFAVENDCWDASECFPWGWGRNEDVWEIFTVEGNRFERRVFEVATGDEWWWRGYYFCGTFPDVLVRGADASPLSNRHNFVDGWVPLDVLRAPYLDRVLVVERGLLTMGWSAVSRLPYEPGNPTGAQVRWSPEPTAESSSDHMAYPVMGSAYYCRVGEDLGEGVVCPESPFWSDEPVILPWEPAQDPWVPPLP